MQRTDTPACKPTVEVAPFYAAVGNEIELGAQLLTMIAAYDGEESAA